MALPRTTFVRRYLLVMSVLTVAAVLASLALRSGVRARSGDVDSATGIPRDAVLGHVGEFQLTDQTGTVFGSQELQGQIYVADFVFTSCAGICPTMSGAMAELNQAFEGDDRVRFVSISVDPETDTPERLAEYGTRFGADPARWKFLTGPMADIEILARDRFMLGFGGEPVQHSPRFVLVDGQGGIRGFFDGTDAASVATLKEELSRMLSESALQH